jgi:hypothetical protein
MSLINLSKSISEAAYSIKRSLAIRDGQKVMTKEKVYDEPCPEGYKRVDGKCERMSLEERQNRSKAAQKDANDHITKRNKNVSMKRRSALITD